MSGKLAPYLGIRPIKTAVLGGTTLTADVWNHIVATYDGDFIHVYVNGVLDGTEDLTSITASPGTTTNVITIGERGDGTDTQYYTGQMDYVKLYDVALSNQEIQELYEASLAYTS